MFKKGFPDLYQELAKLQSYVFYIFKPVEEMNILSNI